MSDEQLEVPRLLDVLIPAGGSQVFQLSQETSQLLVPDAELFLVGFHPLRFPFDLLNFRLDKHLNHVDRLLLSLLAGKAARAATLGCLTLLLSISLIISARITLFFIFVLLFASLWLSLNDGCLGLYYLI